MVASSAVRLLSRPIGILGRISSGRVGWLSGRCWAVWSGMSVTSVFTLEALGQVLEQAAGLRLIQLYFV
jgi:hypothetical protein